MSRSRFNKYGEIENEDNDTVQLPPMRQQVNYSPHYVGNPNEAAAIRLIVSFASVTLIIGFIVFLGYLINRSANNSRSSVIGNIAET